MELYLEQTHTLLTGGAGQDNCESRIYGRSAWTGGGDNLCHKPSKTKDTGYFILHCCHIGTLSLMHRKQMVFC